MTLLFLVTFYIVAIKNENGNYLMALNKAVLSVKHH